MIGKTNSGSRSSYGDIYEFACTPNSNWVSTNIPIAGVKEIFMVYQTSNSETTLDPNAYTGNKFAELDTVNNGVLSKKISIYGGSTSDNQVTALKVVDGIIYFKPILNHKYAYIHMTLVR